MWALIGKVAALLFVLRISWSFIKGLYGSFIASALGLNCNVKKLGKWAVVTGATDGIGKAYAHELARRGMDIILISRSPYKLQNVASEISTQYRVETKIIDVDFTRVDIYDRLQKELKDQDIGVLINNVGMSYSYPELFNDIPDGDKLCEQLINCNIMSLTKMIRIVLPAMEKEHKGLIINLSSLSAAIPCPFLALYAASKAYVESLSRSLAAEYEHKGIMIQCVLPGFVVSNMSGIKRPSLLAPSPLAFVRSALKTSGIERRTAGYFIHKIEMYVIEILAIYLPGFVLSNIAYNQLKTVRAKFLRRIEKEAKSQ